MTVTAHPLVVAVDGGGSKTDTAVVDALTGAVLARDRGPGCSHHQLGIEAAVAVVDSSVAAAISSAGLDPRHVVHAGCYLTAIDLPDEAAAMHAALSASAWAGRSLTVDNDVFALLRAGTESPDAVAVVCGTGINGAAVRGDGATSRVVALGHSSGDWGGASGLAEEILWHAARAEDGRGEPTQLVAALLRWTGRSSVHDVVVAVHRNQLGPDAWWDRMPELFGMAADGDPVAVALVTRQGEEIGLLAASLLARLGLEGAAVPVVLGGGIAASRDPVLTAAVSRILAERAPHADVSVVRDPPIVGAVHLALASVASLV